MHHEDADHAPVLKSKVRARADIPELLIYDVIGGDMFFGGVGPRFVREALDEIGDADEIVVRINSPGGDVFDGNAIANTLTEHPATIHVKIDGMAASIAQRIAMAGDTITMAADAEQMIHNPWAFMAGDADEFRKMADRLDSTGLTLAKTIAARAGRDVDEIAGLMAAETWFTAEEAVAMGLATDIYDPLGIASGVDKRLASALGFKHTSHPPKNKEEEQKPEPYQATDYRDFVRETLLERLAK